MRALRKRLAGQRKIGIKLHRQVPKDHDASRKNSGKEGSIAGNHSKNANFRSEFRGLKIRGKNAK